MTPRQHRPTPADIHSPNRRGIALAGQGDLDGAASQFRQAIAADPSFADGYSNLGNILRMQGHLGEAMTCYQRAVALRPDFAVAHNNLGVVLREQGKLVDAAACHRRALALKPDYAEAYYNLGNIFIDENDLPEAQACYGKCLALKPDYVEAHNNLGNALKDEGKFEEAETCYRRAVALKPGYGEARYNLGNILQDQGRFEESIECFRQAAALNPSHTETQLNLGNALRALGKFEDAHLCYQRARMLDPDHAGAHVNAAMTYLLEGRFSSGWRAYEWRWRMKNIRPHGFQGPLWDGGNFHGKTLLLHGEQGLGDNIQFVRYAPLVKERGGRVLLVCPLPLVRLFKSVKGIDEIIPEGAVLPDYDFHVPLLSLPLLFNTQLDTIPSATPYLVPLPGEVAIWAERLRGYSARKVGLVWAGNPRMNEPRSRAIDRLRSLSLNQFASLATVSNVEFFSLQKGSPAAQAKTPRSELALVDFMNEVDDFADTAALIANLDLVIGVDTSVIHLAAAMGKPVWVLSRFDGCWRWLSGREDSPWYPTLRLFRQPSFGDWHAVVENVRAALAQLL